MPEQPPLIKPPALRPGDTIGVITPGRAASFPARVERGRRELERLGYRVKFGEHALQPSQTEAERVADIHALFRDPQVRAVLLTLAGEAPVIAGLLPLLDYGLIAGHPKILVGQSAATTLLHTIYRRTGLVTFHGPSLVQHFGNLGGVDDLTVANFQAVLGGEAVDYPMSERHSDEFWDWDIDDQPRTFRPSPPWRCLRGGRVVGPLLGGSLRLIARQQASEDALDYRGAVFFWDIPMAFDAPPAVEAAIAPMRLVREAGVIDAMGGMVAGKPYLYDGRGETPPFDDLIREHLLGGGQPVIAGVDCGHTVPLLTFPIGVPCELNADALSLRLLEPAVVEA